MTEPQQGSGAGLPPRRPGRLPWFRVWTLVAAIGLVAGLFLTSGELPQLTARLVHALGMGRTPIPGLEELDHRILPKVEAPKSRRGYTFMKRERDGSPVTFSPCRPWNVVVNLAGAPAGAYAVVAGAVRTVRSATGLDLRLAGRTDERPTFRRNPYQPDAYGDRWAPILIGWTGAEGGEFAGQGGPITATGADGHSEYVSGVVGIDRDGSFNADPTALRAILLHELGHVVGLGHVADPSQIMYPVQNSQREYGQGDLAGLARLGNGPCAPGI